MQSLSNERSFPSTYRPENLGHRRRPSIGKSMPVTALLLNFPPKTTKRSYDTLSKDGLSSPELEKPPILFKLNEVNDDNSNNDSYSQHSSSTSILSSSQSLTSSSISTSSSSKEEIFEMDSYENDKNLEQNNNYEILISDLSDNDGNYDMVINKENDEDEKCSLVNNMKENCDRIPTPICSICLQGSDDYDNDDPENLQKDKPKNIDDNDCKENNFDIFHKLCKKLCNDNCKMKKINVKNYENKENYCEMNKLNNEIETENNLNKVTDNRIKLSSRIDAERRNFLNDMLTKIDSASSSSSSSSDVIDENNVNKLSSDLVNDDNENNMEIVEEDHDESSSSNQFSLRDFNEKYAIAEALAKTSMMTSPAVKRRLAARKIEFELDNNNNNNIDTIINGNDDVFSLIKSETHKTGTGTGNEDFIKSNIDKEYIPPRELLMYLVRMGSFNSAPKINNPDSQDDSFEIPNGLSTRDLLQHCKIMRGENRPKLLSRQFLKPITNYNTSSMISTNDITEGLHVLELNAISKVCNPPLISPKHIRVFQWNMLSQSLGQHNDNFVCCPDEALLWDNRKYLIIEEILRNSPDIICLQEVDHFKFLERVLSTQNYVGIFFPKPDSPCLYIEENNGPDGCAIFYKNEKFNLINYQTRILEVWRVQSNQVAICINLKINDTNKELCICTTHLKARNGALLSKLRNEQGKDLLKFVTNVSENRPLILCGDFNAEPIEPVYSTILNYKDLNLSSAYADIQSEIKKLSNKNNSSIKLDINNCCTNNDVDQHDHIGCNNDINDTKIENNNNNEMKNEKFFDNNTLTEAEILANYEPPYTTWKIREEGEVCHTIDYMFYSKNHFKVNNCLMFPNEEEVGKDRTPSLQYPSDHFSLVCDFEIIDKDDKK